MALSRGQLLTRAFRELVRLAKANFHGTVEMDMQDGHVIRLTETRSRLLHKDAELEPCTEAELDAVLKGRG